MRSPHLVEQKHPLGELVVGGGALVGNQGNATFVSHRCLLVLAFVRGEVASQVKATQLFGEGVGSVLETSSFLPQLLSPFVWFGTELTYPPL